MRANPFHSLFTDSIPDTAGGRVFFKLFELFLVGFTIQLSWEWAIYTLRLREVVLPLGIANYIDVSFMFGNSLPLVTAAAISIVFIAGFFRINRWSYLVGMLLFHVLFAVRFSQGEIPHSANLFGMSVLGLAIAMPFFDEAIGRQRFTLGFTYFYLGLAYTLAGICKLIGTGAGWSDGRHLWMWINEKAVDHFSKFGIFELNWLQRLSLDSHVVATLVLTVGLVTEICAVLVWWRRFRKPVLIAILVMHFGIWISMNIMFKLSVYELLLLLLPLPAIFDNYVKADSPLGATIARFAQRFA